MVVVVVEYCFQLRVMSFFGGNAERYRRGVKVAKCRQKVQRGVGGVPRGDEFNNLGRRGAGGRFSAICGRGAADCGSVGVPPVPRGPRRRGRMRAPDMADLLDSTD